MNRLADLTSNEKDDLLVTVRRNATRFIVNIATLLPVGTETDEAIFEVERIVIRVEQAIQGIE